MSSVTTNIRFGAGGAFSIISQSLGLEVGGSIGIPLYLSQALAVAMYLFGFRAGWQYTFPHHPALLVDFGAFSIRKRKSIAAKEGTWGFSSHPNHHEL
jgi:solute carrier family 12 sodium/potassium/chloride transporter 2